MSGYPNNPPAYNPSAPQPQQSGVGFEHYQQGANPPYSQPPPQYTPYPQQPYPQQPYPQQPYHGAYQGPMYAPEGNVLYRDQPKTVYVYGEDQRRQDKPGGEDCLLFALCAACLCCCLMND